MFVLGASGFVKECLCAIGTGSLVLAAMFVWYVVQAAIVGGWPAGRLNALGPK